jgi:hypothetical protein
MFPRTVLGSQRGQTEGFTEGITVVDSVAVWLLLEREGELAELDAAIGRIPNATAASC